MEFRIFDYFGFFIDGMKKCELPVGFLGNLLAMTGEHGEVLK